MASKGLVYCVAKYPTPGKSKTRLIPLFGGVNAAALSKCMLLDTLEMVLGARDQTRDVCVYFAPESDEIKMRALVSEVQAQGTEEGLELLPIPSVVQRTASSNLTAVLTHALEQGKRHVNAYSSITFVGSDCPHLPHAEVERGVRIASDGGAYLVPASDGGYVLLSLPVSCPLGVFQDVEWSAENTLESQLARLTAVGVHTTVGTIYYRDVDEPEDAMYLLNDFVASDSQSCRRTLDFIQTCHQT